MDRFIRKKLFIKPLLVSLFIYLSGILMGVFLGFILPNSLGQPKPSSIDSWIVVAINNTEVHLTMFIGFLSAGLLTIILLLFNGFLMGTFIGYSLNYGCFKKILALTLPHGILEIPATLIAGGLAFSFLSFIWKWLKQKEKIPFSKYLIHLLFWLVIMILLTIIAAIIEQKVTLI